MKNITMKSWINGRDFEVDLIYFKVYFHDLKLISFIFKKFIIIIFIIIVVYNYLNVITLNKWIIFLKN